MDLHLSPAGRERLKRFEGFRAAAYIPVTGDVPTIGYGFTRGVRMGDRMTLDEADARLTAELRDYERAVTRGCTRAPNQNQFDAMVLLTWNIGAAGFARSTVLKAHNRGDDDAAARAFALWNQSGGRVPRGLTRRRAEEAALYLTPVDDPIEPDTAPRVVDGERPMRASEINRAGVAAGGSAAVAAVAETTRALSDVKDSTLQLGDWIVPLLCVAVVALVAYMVWQRVRQRREGWA